MDVLGSDIDSIIEVVENKIQVKRLYSKIKSCLDGREKIDIKNYLLGIVKGGKIMRLTD